MRLHAGKKREYEIRLDLKEINRIAVTKPFQHGTTCDAVCGRFGHSLVFATAWLNLCF